MGLQQTTFGPMAEQELLIVFN